MPTRLPLASVWPFGLDLAFFWARDGRRPRVVDFLRCRPRRVDFLRRRSRRRGEASQDFCWLSTSRRGFFTLSTSPRGFFKLSTPPRLRKCSMQTAARPKKQKNKNTKLNKSKTQRPIQCPPTKKNTSPQKTATMALRQNGFAPKWP